MAGDVPGPTAVLATASDELGLVRVAVILLVTLTIYWAETYVLDRCAHPRAARPHPG